MIPCSRGHSLNEVLAELDRVLPRIDADCQKPTTYRSRRRSYVARNIKKNLVVLPAGLEIYKILEELGNSLSQRYLLILSSIYSRGLMNKKIQSRRGAFLRCFSPILRELGGERYKLLLNYGGNNGHIIKSDEPAVDGVQSFQYRLNPDKVSLIKQQRFEITTKHAIAARENHIRLSKERFLEFQLGGTGNSSLRYTWAKIAKSYEGVTFDYFGALDYVASIKEDVNREYRRNFLENLIFNGSVWFTDKQGRNYTTMVDTPRDIRVFFSFGKEPLWIVDITSSQPVIHLALYPSESEEKKRYRHIVEGGTFWDFMNERSGGFHDLLDPDKKTEFKKSIFREIFYSWHEDDLKKPRELALIFAREFPILWQKINEHKQANAVRNRNFKPSAPLAKAMQTTEAEIVAEAVASLKDKPYPLITIHDAIVTTKDGIDDVKTALGNSFSQMGIYPRLVPKILSKDRVI